MAAVQPIHTAVPGRARFRIDGLHGSELLKLRLEAKLSGVDGIEVVSASTVTGTVLVCFDRAKSARQIKTVLERALRSRTKRAEAPLGLQKDRTWHVMEAETVVAEFGTSKLHGLSGASIEANSRKYGPNVLPEAVPRSGLSIFLDQFKSLPVALLGVAAAFSLATGGLADALVITSVVAVNAAIGYGMESQSEKIIHSLKRLAHPSVSVIRNGASTEVSVRDVVPGDLLTLRPGSYVSADARLVEVNDLSVDESALTGESVAVVKTASSLARINMPLADRVNMVYRGTLVTGGRGLAVVVATGNFTEMGKIQSLVAEASAPETPMQRQLGQLGSQLALIGTGMCVLVFGIGIVRGQGLIAMLKTAISLAVAAIPEGLPAVATTTLALGMQRMRKQHVLVRRLEAVETLGCVQTICLDKTGTLTFNRMSVVSIYAGHRRINFRNGEFHAARVRVDPFHCDELLRLIHVAALCNDTEITKDGAEYVLKGSSTESALVHMAIDAGVDVVRIRRQYPLLFVNQRSEQRNFMASVHSVNADTQLVALKGSPPEVMAMCESYSEDGVQLPLTDEDRLRIETENNVMCGRALRVLGVAYRYERKDDKRVDIGNGLIWLGLIGMIDPIRTGVKQVISSFHQAAINTVMITGDQSSTANAIAKELNLSRDGPLKIMDSTQLAPVDPQVLKAISTQVQVFARVSPKNKLQIVQALQRAGNVVAMTGDGINDGPALKAADIGIAMGHTGTDAAREIADIILEDDELQTMIVAVSEGRRIYDNVRKSVHFLVSTNLSEILVMLTATSAGLGQPLNAMQLLWINLMTDVAPALALAFEPPEPDVFNRPPRRPDESIIEYSTLRRMGFESAVLSAGALGAYGYGLLRHGPGPRAGTMAFLSLTNAQLLHTFSCRSESRSVFSPDPLRPNHYLNLALGGSFAVQLIAGAIPVLRSLLGLTPTDVVDKLIIGASAALAFAVNEASKNLGGRPSVGPRDLDKPTKSRTESYAERLPLHVAVGD